MKMDTRALTEAEEKSFNRAIEAIQHRDTQPLLMSCKLKKPIPAGDVPVIAVMWPDEDDTSVNIVPLALLFGDDVLDWLGPPSKDGVKVVHNPEHKGDV